MAAERACYIDFLMMLILFEIRSFWQTIGSLMRKTQGKQQPCVQWYQVKTKPCWAITTQLIQNDYNKEQQMDIVDQVFKIITTQPPILFNLIQIMIHTKNHVTLLYHSATLGTYHKALECPRKIPWLAAWLYSIDVFVESDWLFAAHLQKATAT